MSGAAAIPGRVEASVSTTAVGTAAPTSTVTPARSFRFGTAGPLQLVQRAVSACTAAAAVDGGELNRVFRRGRRDGGGEVDGDFQSRLEARVDRLQDETGLTGVTVAVMTDGQLAGVAAAGERRRGSGIPVTVDDRWHVGSITKSMTATLLAVLEDDGRLSRDDTLPALLPDIEMAGGWDACTLHHLLTHTAGAGVDLPNRVQSVWPDTAEELVAARRRFIADILDKEPESPCGERFAYSNVGYTIAGHIAETVAGTPYEALLQERVFAPLMLASAGFGPPQGDAPNQEPIGHVVLLRWFRLRADPFKTRADNSPVTSPAGAVHMTIGDLARFGEAHLQGESATSPPLLPRAAWERLHTPFLDDYASGWVRVERDWAGGPVLWHNGSNTMWYALLMLLPARNTVLAFATNDGAIQAAETAFVELARELGGGPAPAS